MDTNGIDFRLTDEELQQTHAEEIFTLLEKLGEGYFGY
jgi:hypothetical protein